MNLGQQLKMNASKYPDTLALVDEDRKFTYPETNQRVNLIQQQDLLNLLGGFQPFRRHAPLGQKGAHTTQPAASRGNEIQGLRRRYRPRRNSQLVP